MISQKILLITVLFVFSVSLSGCGKSSLLIDPPSQGDGDTTWSYTSSITEPLTSTVSPGSETTLGNIATDKVSISIAPDALPAETAVTVQTPTSVPKIFGDEIQPLWAPIEIAVGTTSTRLDEKATISFAFDPTLLEPGTVPSELRVMYFNGQEWEYIRPLMIDMTWWRVSFETYHFSLLGLNKIKDKTTLTEEWIHSKTLDEELKKNLNKMSDHVTNQIIDLTLQKMGINDKSLKGQILADVLKDDSYKGIYDAYQKGDIVGMNQKIVLLSGKKIAKMVPDSAYKTALKTTLDLKGDIEAVSKAAGFAAEGRYEDAARIIGENIADKFLITTAGKIAVEVMQGQIDSRKNKEVEAAYMAYKNGADGYFRWYNVDPGDFNAVRDQMRGIRRQLEIDAIAKQNTIRRESGMEPLTAEQEEMVREWVKTSYQKQFETRKEREVEITKEEEKLRLIINGFAGADFFSDALGPVGLDKGYDFEAKLDILDHFARKMMQDTGRFNVSTKEWLLVEWALQITDLVQAARYYFSWPDGKKAYNQFLKDRFGIVIAPTLEELAGNRQGTATITSVVLSEEAKKQMAEGETSEWCDFSINPEELIGQSSPVSMTITPEGKEGGTLTIVSVDEEWGGDTQTTPFMYDEGVLTASISQEWVSGKLTLTMTNEGKSLKWTWPMVAKYGDLATITIQFSISK